MTDSTTAQESPGDASATTVEPPSAAAIAKSVQSIRNWLIVLTVLVTLTFGAAVIAVVVASVGVASMAGIMAGVSQGQLGVGFGPDASEGPPLSNVASLPVDALGAGTIQGAPTGESMSSDDRGTFVLVLVPAPTGLPPRTTVRVGFDHSTKVYRSGQPLGDVLASMNDEDGTGDSDPSAAGSVVVRFHIKDGRVFADRLDLSDEPPPGFDF